MPLNIEAVGIWNFSISPPRFNFEAPFQFHPRIDFDQTNSKIRRTPIDLLLKQLLLAKTIDKRMISAIEGGAKEIAKRSIDLAVVYGLWRPVYDLPFKSGPSLAPIVIASLNPGWFWSFQYVLFKYSSISVLFLKKIQALPPSPKLWPKVGNLVACLALRWRESSSIESIRDG